MIVATAIATAADITTRRDLDRGLRARQLAVLCRHAADLPVFSSSAGSPGGARSYVLGATRARKSWRRVGYRSGVARLIADQDPSPAGLRAATRKKYRVPLVSPVTVNWRAVDTPSLTVVHGPDRLAATVG